METRANHLLIGSFVLTTVISLLLVIAWLARLDVNQRRSHYDIYFEGSVAGLGVGGDVRYRGIRIGRVSSIRIAPDDPGKVWVTTEITDGPSLRVGDEAELQLQGLTGVAFINIQGANASSPPLQAGEEQLHPVIPSRPSQIEKLFAGAPELLNRGILLAEQLSQLFGAENRALVTATLRDLNAVSSTLADERGRIASLLDELQRDGQSLRQLADELRVTAGKADAFFDAGGQTMRNASHTLSQVDSTLAQVDQALNQELGQTLSAAREAAAGFAGAARELQALLGETREPMRDFAVEGLLELSRFASEARELTRSMDRMVERFEQEGLRYLVVGGGAGDFDAEDAR